MSLLATFIISSSSVTPLPAGVISNGLELGAEAARAVARGTEMCIGLVVAVHDASPPSCICLVERKGVEVALDIAGRIGVGDVFGQHPLARLMPAHLVGQRLKDRNAGKSHLQTLFTKIGKFCRPMVKSWLTKASEPAPFASHFAQSAAMDRQNLLWLRPYGGRQSMESGMQFMTSLFGGTENTFLNAAFALGIVLVLIVLGLWGLKLLTRAGANVGRGRKRRLTVVDSAMVDRQAARW